MRAYHVQIDKHGRLLIPAQIRNTFDYKTGDTFIVKAQNHEVHFISLSQAVSTAQELFKSKSSNVDSAVDEFLQRKYEDAKLENVKY